MKMRVFRKDQEFGGYFSVSVFQGLQTATNKGALRKMFHGLHKPATNKEGLVVSIYDSTQIMIATTKGKG